MAPRRMAPKGDHTPKVGSSRGGAGSQKRGAQEQKTDIPEEPEIDIAAVLQECLEESSAKIAAVLQQRQEQLMATINQCDTALSSGRRPAKK